MNKLYDAMMGLVVGDALGVHGEIRTWVQFVSCMQMSEIC